LQEADSSRRLSTCQKLAVLDGNLYAGCGGIYKESTDTIRGKTVWDCVQGQCIISDTQNRFIYWCYGHWLIMNSGSRSDFVANNAKTCSYLAIAKAPFTGAEWYDSEWSNGDAGDAFCSTSTTLLATALTRRDTGCSCSGGTPCLRLDEEKCFGTGNANDYPDNAAIEAKCWDANNPITVPCIDERVVVPDSDKGEESYNVLHSAASFHSKASSASANYRGRRLGEDVFGRARSNFTTYVLSPPMQRTEVG